MEKLKEEAGFYLLFRSTVTGYSEWIEKDSGRGRVLTHFLNNFGKRVTLDKIAEISGWSSPKKRFNELKQRINNSSPYQIEVVEIKTNGEISYEMREK